MLEARVLDADRRVRHGRQADERSDLDVVGADAVRGAAEALRALDGHVVGADAVDARTERDEEVREVLHVRLARRVAKDRVGRSPRRRP